MGITLVLGISVLLQFSAALLALRLIRVTGKRTAWILIALAISLMALRRLIPLFGLLSGDMSHPPDLINELVGLVISIFMLVGVVLIVPLFLSIRLSEEKLKIEVAERKQAEEELRKHRENLEELVKERSVQLEATNQQLQQDITERKQIEEALRESEERYRKLVASVTDYIYTVKIENGRPVATTHCPACISVTGYTTEEYEADSHLWYKIIYEEDKKVVLEQAEKVLKGEKVLPLEHRIIHKDSSIHWVMNTPVPRFDEKGQLVAYDGLIVDITEHKRLEEQFLQAQKMEAIGRFAGGIAHDFNNILTAIGGNTELLKESLPQKGEPRELVEEILESTDKAVGLTRQLLTFSRRQPIQPKVLKVNELILNLQKMLQRIIGEDIDLKILLGEDLGLVKVDPGQIEQVLLNLAVNSRDAMPEGGKLTIETKNAYLDEDYANEHLEVKPGNYVLISVTDTGTGMSEEVKKHLFEPFFTTKETGKGSGLGLSVAFGIIKRHQGHISVYSELGKGTFFHIYLPLTEEKEEEKVTPLKAKRGPLPRGKETILIVEDDLSVRTFTTRALKNLGYTVLEASNAEEALKVLKDKEKAKIDLLLTDMIMPKMSGKELAEKIKVHHPQIKVILTSGYSYEHLKSHGILEKEFYFLEKPLSIEALAKKVREVLGE